MELLLKTFSLTQDEFELHNKKSTQHIKSYFNRTMDTNIWITLTIVCPNIASLVQINAGLRILKNFVPN